MLKQLKKTESEGLTIVEVMIVLAIAGLIMLIVFLAVPALQRNSRNTQRTADASRITAAVDECLTNNNGQTGPCDTLDPAADEVDDYIDLADNQQLTNSVTTDPTTAQLNHIRLEFSTRCAETGDDNEGAGTRAFTVLYRLEGRGTVAPMKCVGS